MEDILKILVVGDITVGKTTALRRLANRPNAGKVVPTVAIEFYAGEVQVGTRTFRMHFWDTAGQRSYWQYGLSHVDQSDAVVVMYDLTSFASLHTARQLIDRNQGILEIKRVPLLLFGNKLDLCSKNGGRDVHDEVKSVMKDVQGIIAEGSAFVDSSLQRALVQLIKKFFCTEIIFEGQQKAKKCCC